MNFQRVTFPNSYFSKQQLFQTVTFTDFSQTNKYVFTVWVCCGLGLLGLCIHTHALRVNYVCIAVYPHPGLPGVPGDLEVIGQRSDGNESTIVDLRWSPPEDTGGVTLDRYTLTITSSSPPPTFLSRTILTNDTTYTVTLPSNMTYNMAVTASNCAGTGLARSELLNLSFSKYSSTGSYFK